MVPSPDFLALWRSWRLNDLHAVTRPQMSTLEHPRIRPAPARKEVLVHAVEVALHEPARVLIARRRIASHFNEHVAPQPQPHPRHHQRPIQPARRDVFPRRTGGHRVALRRQRFDHLDSVQAERLLRPPVVLGIVLRIAHNPAFRHLRLDDWQLGHAAARTAQLHDVRRAFSRFIFRLFDWGRHRTPGFNLCRLMVQETAVPSAAQPNPNSKSDPASGLDSWYRRSNLHQRRSRNPKSKIQNPKSNHEYAASTSAIRALSSAKSPAANHAMAGSNRLSSSSTKWPWRIQSSFLTLS